MEGIASWTKLASSKRASRPRVLACIFHLLRISPSVTAMYIIAYEEVPGVRDPKARQCKPDMTEEGLLCREAVHGG